MREKSSSIPCGYTSNMVEKGGRINNKFGPVRSVFSVVRSLNGVDNAKVCTNRDEEKGRRMQWRRGTNYERKSEE